MKSSTVPAKWRHPRAAPAIQAEDCRPERVNRGDGQPAPCSASWRIPHSALNRDGEGVQNQTKPARRRCTAHADTTHRVPQPKARIMPPRTSSPSTLNRGGACYATASSCSTTAANCSPTAAVSNHPKCASRRSRERSLHSCPRRRSCVRFRSASPSPASRRSRWICGRPPAESCRTEHRTEGSQACLHIRSDPPETDLMESATPWDELTGYRLIWG